MRIPKKYLLLAGAAAILTGAAVAPVLAQPGHGRGGSGMSMLETFDTNDDGRLTQEEIDTYRQQQLSRFDRDQNSQLSIEEYQALWAEAMRERMVRQFQRHDRDGDGQVTVEEFQARYTDLVADRDDNGDGAITRDELRPRGHRHGRDGGPQGRGPGPDGDRD
jgi:hypothetical protein